MYLNYTVEGLGFLRCFTNRSTNDITGVETRPLCIGYSAIGRDQTIKSRRASRRRRNHGFRRPRFHRPFARPFPVSLVVFFFFFFSFLSLSLSLSLSLGLFPRNLVSCKSLSGNTGCRRRPRTMGCFLERGTSPPYGPLYTCIYVRAGFIANLDSSRI